MRFGEYDPAYPSVFAEVVTRIRATCFPDVRVEHTGSTSVPGLGVDPLSTWWSWPAASAGLRHVAHHSTIRGLSCSSISSCTAERRDRPRPLPRHSPPRYGKAPCLISASGLRGRPGSAFMLASIVA